MWSWTSKTRPSTVHVSGQRCARRCSSAGLSTYFSTLCDIFSTFPLRKLPVASSVSVEFKKCVSVFMYLHSLYVDLYSEQPFRDGDKHITSRRRAAGFCVLFTDTAVSLADGDWSYSAVKST